MPRPKRFDYYMDEVDWSCGHGYRMRIPYIDATGAKRIYHQTFWTRKLGLDMLAAKRLARNARPLIVGLLSHTLKRPRNLVDASGARPFPRPCCPQAELD